MNVMKNGEGYTDETSGKAIQNVGWAEDIKRGEIYEYTMSDGRLRHVVILSNNDRKADRYISICVLTDEPKSKYSVPVACEGMKYANLNSVSYTERRRIGPFMRLATAEEMSAIDDAIMGALGIDYPGNDGREDAEIELADELKAENAKITNELKAMRAKIEALKEENNTLRQNDVDSIVRLAKAEAEMKVYKELYTQAIRKLMEAE